MLRLLFILSFTFLYVFAETLSLTTPIVQKNRKISFDPNEQIAVNIDSKILKKNQTISIDLPQNITVSFENSNFIFRKDGDFAWQGKPINGAVDDFSLFTTKNGKTYGVIVFNHTKYILQSKDDGSYKIFKEQKKSIDHNDFLKLPPRKINYMTPDELNTTSKPKTKSKPLLSHKLRISNSIVDVLVLYTQAYADYYGSGLSAKIQYSIDYANTAMTNSDVLLTYNLAHQHLFENADSNESTSIDNALSRISAIDTSNGQTLDINVNADIRQLRAEYNADLTTLFRLNTAGGWVGLGWIASNNSKTDMRHSSFNVSEFSDETFAHESGHNLGCGHSRDIDNCDGALYSYACGYDDGTIGTIMSYNSSTINYFSTPNKTYDGTTIGDADTDCSRAINDTRTSMANISDISEINEVGDAYSNNTITGSLDPETDRDQYQIGLGGTTTIEMSSQYSNIAFYLNLYDSNGYLIDSYITSSTTITLANGTYNLIISNQSDATNSTYSATKDYTINITSNYVEPINKPITPIITYLLF